MTTQVTTTTDLFQIRALDLGAAHGTVHYLVPTTGHWADWQDAAAIAHHGLPVRAGELDQIRRAVADLSTSTWDEVAAIHHLVRSGLPVSREAIERLT